MMITATIAGTPLVPEPVAGVGVGVGVAAAGGAVGPGFCGVTRIEGTVEAVTTDAAAVRTAGCGVGGGGGVGVAGGMGVGLTAG